MISSCVLAQMVQLEKNPGVLHQMMKIQEGVDAMLGIVQASDPFKQMIVEFDRINEIPKLIEGKQPQCAALGILKDIKFKQVLNASRSRNITARKRATHSRRPTVITEWCILI